MIIGAIDEYWMNKQEKNALRGEEYGKLISDGVRGGIKAMKFKNRNQKPKQ